jgi:hypothetical protein
VTVPQKILCSFLLSALLCAGIAALAFVGIVGGLAQISIFVAIFLTLFLIIFFCFNLRRDSAEEIPEHDADIEAVQVESVTGLGGSLFMFRQPFTFSPGNPELLQEATEVVYEQDGIHYINNNVFADEKSEEALDLNFSKLVESVVENKELELT